MIELNQSRVNRNNTIANMIVGIIFILNGVSYLDDIVVSVIPKDWEKITVQKMRDYEFALMDVKEAQKLEDEGVDFSPMENYQKEKEWTQASEEGRVKTIDMIKQLKKYDSDFFLMNDNTRLFLYVVVATLLLVLGGGFLMSFAWTNWFILLTVSASFFWQTYTFIYEMKIDQVIFNSQNEINALLHAPAVAHPALWMNPAIFNLFLQTFSFFGILYYLFYLKSDDTFDDMPTYSARDVMPELKDKLDS